MDLDSLKSSHSNFDKLTKALESKFETQDKSKDKYTDDRFWKPELDKTGNGYAVIRFLPAVTGEDLPWQRVWSHAFQGPGGWYIENSLTTLNQKDPVSEENTRLWNTGVDSDKEIARKRKRKLSYYANILIVSDPKHPENEGKVFLYKFGKKIFDKIAEKMTPAFEDESPVNPFDFWKGANFKLKIRKVDGYWNYDKSEFEAVSEVADSDDKIKEIWSKQHPLKPFLAPDNFKTYDELKEKLNRVIAGTRKTESVENVDLPNNKSNGSVKSNGSESAIDDIDDDSMSYFSKLAEDE
jgi:hypothetical protein